MAYRRRYAEQISWFSKSHVDHPPMNAAERQDKLRAGDRSFLDRLRHFGGGVPRRADAYWADRSGDVDARSHYRVEKEGGGPTLFITWRCAEFHRPELLDRMGDRIYIATGESVDLREDAARRYQAAQDYSPRYRIFPRRGSYYT